MNIWKGISYFFFAMGIISLIGLINYSGSFEAFISRRTTKELDITTIDFIYGNATTGQIIISTVNSGNNARAQDVTVSKIKINNEQASSWEATNSATVTVGATETFTVTQEIESGNKYTISIFEKDGTLIGSLTSTA